MLLWGAFSEQWSLRHPVTFDGVNKLIIIASDISEINVKIDIYSKWKEWIQLYDNAKFAPAIRTTGGDAIGGGAFTGDVYFLINNWQIYIDHTCVIDGVLFSDNFPSPFVSVPFTNIVTNKVAALSTVISPTVIIDDVDVPSVAEIREEMDTNSTKLAAINTKVQTLQNTAPAPTASAVAAAVRTELAPELAEVLTLEANITGAIGSGALTPTQETMLLEMYQLLGLDPTKPLIVTTTARTAGTINQEIDSTPESTIVTRV